MRLRLRGQPLQISAPLMRPCRVGRTIVNCSKFSFHASVLVLSMHLFLSIFPGLSAVNAQEPAPKVGGLSAYPLDICAGLDGVAFVVDRNLPGIWQRTADQLTVLIQGKEIFRTPLNAARCLALDRDGSLLVGDSATRDIYRVAADGNAIPLTGGRIGIPLDIAVRSDGTIFVADLELRMLVRIGPGSSEVEHVAQVNPRGLFIDASDQVWVVSQGAQQLQIVDDAGKSEVIVGQRLFEFPQQVVVDAEGVAFVSDSYKKAIWKIVKGSEPEICHQGGPLSNPVGLAIIDGRLTIVDPHSRKVFRVDDQQQLEVWFGIGD